MLQLSTAAILEKNRIAQEGVWVTLLELEVPDEDSLRICYNTEDITWGGRVWTAFPFALDTVQQNKSETPTVTVRISNVTRAIEQYIETYRGFVGCTVTLRIVNSKYLDNEVAEVEESFVVQKTSSTYEWATFELGGALPVRLRYPQRRTLKDWCPYAYKGIECGATSSLPECPHTLKGCKERNNATRFGGEPSMRIGGQYASNS